MQHNKEQGKKMKGGQSQDKRYGGNESSCTVKKQNKGRKATDHKNTRKQTSAKWQGKMQSRSR